MNNLSADLLKILNNKAAVYCLLNEHSEQLLFII